MPVLLENFVQAFIPLFVAMDPIGLSAVFVAMGRDASPATRRRVSHQAVLTSGIVALIFLYLGKGIFSAVGITVGDFQIAGGLILFILATRDLTHSAAEEPPVLAEDFGVVPLGMPLIAGPATIATLLLMAQNVGTPVTLAALAVNLLIIALVFAQAERLARRIGPTGLRAISKIISLLLAAIAVNMIRKGWAG